MIKKRIRQKSIKKDQRKNKRGIRKNQSKRGYLIDGEVQHFMLKKPMDDSYKKDRVFNKNKKEIKRGF